MSEPPQFDLREWLVPSVLMSILFGLPLAAARFSPVVIGLRRSDGSRHQILSGSRNGQ